MSITQTYFLAHKARAKLSQEAAQPDHNLRLLVGHANLLDSLMLDLADAEREQESWFTQSVQGASPTHPKSEERHVQWADSIGHEDDWDVDSSDSDSEDEDEDVDEDVEMEDAPVPLSRIPSRAVPPPSPMLEPMDTEFDDGDEEEEYDSLILTRSPSHPASPPELEHDEDPSDDESMPPSPPIVNIPSFSQKQRETTVSTKYFDPTQDDDDEDGKSDFYHEGYYLPPRNPTTRLVPTIPVY